MAERIARLANLTLAGLLTGNELSGLVAIHPALGATPPGVHLPAEQAIYRRYGAIMPIYMGATIASFLPVLALDRDPQAPAFRLTAAGLACYAAMLGLTLARNLPLNARIVALPAEESSYDEFRTLRARWDRLHAARSALNVAGLLCTALGTVLRAEARGAK